MARTGKNTWEYKVMEKNMAEIIEKLAEFKLSGKIAYKLRAAKLIGNDIKDLATNTGPSVTEPMRIRAIIDSIIARVEMDAQRYHDFRTTLLEDADSEAVVLRYLPASDIEMKLRASTDEQIQILQQELETRDTQLTEFRANNECLRQELQQAQQQVEEKQQVIEARDTMLRQLNQKLQAIEQNLLPRASNRFHSAAKKDSHKQIYFAYNQTTPNSTASVVFLSALNQYDEDGYTPLMLAVKLNHFKSAMALLVAGADPDVRQADSSNTALHYASKLGNPAFVKLLIVFFADLKAANKARKTPLDVARERKSECAVLLQETIEMTDRATASDASPRISIPDDSVFLLALDGGGMQCLATTQILLSLDRRMKELQLDRALVPPPCKKSSEGSPGCEANSASLGSYFDYIAGTGFGSFTALGFGFCNATLEMSRAVALRVSKDVMVGSPPFSSAAMDQCLRETFGEDVVMASSQNPRVIVTAVRGDLVPTSLHLMCNYGEAAADRKVWEAARASSATPLFFEPMGQLIDGGVMAANPTLTATTEILNQGDKVGLVLSIGAGITPQTAPAKWPGGFGFLGWLFPSVKQSLSVLSLASSRLLQSDIQDTEKAAAMCKSMGAPYFRFSPHLRKNYSGVETDPVTLTDMMYEGHLYALSEANRIDLVAKILLSRGPVN